jgi:hypothetical protein
LVHKRVLKNLLGTTLESTVLLDASHRMKMNLMSTLLVQRIL